MDANAIDKYTDAKSYNKCILYNRKQVRVKHYAREYELVVRWIQIQFMHLATIGRSKNSGIQQQE